MVVSVRKKDRSEYMVQEVKFSRFEECENRGE